MTKEEALRSQIAELQSKLDDMARQIAMLRDTLVELDKYMPVGNTIVVLNATQQSAWISLPPAPPAQVLGGGYPSTPQSQWTPEESVRVAAMQNATSPSRKEMGNE